MLIGAGAKFFAAKSAAKSRERIAQINYNIDMSNARIGYGNQKTQLRLNTLAGRIELDAQRTNMRLSLAGVEAQKQYAERLRMFARAKTKQGRLAISRQLKSFDEMQSDQGAAVAGSGVTMGGSALDIMIESAEQMKLKIQDMHDQDNFERQAAMDDAAMRDIGADRDAAVSRARFGYAQHRERIGRRANRLGRATARTAFHAARMEAEMARLGQQSQAQAQKSEAAAGLLGSVVNTAVKAYSYGQASGSSGWLG
jgi:hypothetical protein